MGIIIVLFFKHTGLCQNVPVFTIGIPNIDKPEGFSTVIQILILLTVLTLAPAILILLTSFTRILVVFSFLRQALGTHQMPPNQVMIGLSLFMTFFIMSPVLNKIKEEALNPYMDNTISQEQAIEKATRPLQNFMLKQTRKKDLALFIKFSPGGKPEELSETPLSTLVPAFIISELKTAFQIGFLIYIPFLIIDMVIASILLSMGMLMLPPIMISLPFKLMLFVLADGWNLLVGSMIKSFL